MKTIFLPAAVCLAFFSCDFSFAPPSGGEREIPPPAVWADGMFEEEEIENGVTKTVFRTNDEKFRTSEGSTVWTVRGEKSEIFASRTVKAAKASGNSSGGYGIVFCHDTYVVGGNAVQAMLVAMINNDGGYITGKAVGSAFTPFGWWKTSPFVNRIPGSANEITVSYDEEKDEYVLSINGNETERFKDGSEPFLRKGRNGYVVVITPFDNFPVTGIDVSFFEGKK